MKLNNQVFVVDKQLGTKFVYDVYPEDIEFLKARGEIDNDGNIILTTPGIAALKRPEVKDLFDTVDKYVELLGVPQLKIEKKTEKNYALPNLNNCTNDQLAELLSFFGGWRAYLEGQVAQVESRKAMLESLLEIETSKTLVLVTEQYKSEEKRKPGVESLKSEAMQLNPKLKKIHLSLAEMQGMFIRINGIRNQYKSYYEAVSRVVALRTAFKEEGI